VVVCGCLFKNVKSFNGIEVGAFILGVQNLHAFLPAVLPRVVRILRYGGCVGRFSCVRYIWF